MMKIFQSIQKHGWKEFLIRARGFAEWAWYKHVLRAPTMQRQIYGYKMMLDLKDPGISTTLAKGILREKDQVTVLTKELKPGTIVLDIGANIGYYALLEASLVGPQGKVYAVEPVPHNYELLKKNIALNGFEKIVETYPVAIADVEKEEKFYLSAHSNLGSFFPTDMATGKTLSYMDKDYMMVKTLAVADFIRSKGRIDIIRMDIEGAEVEVFRGLLQVIDEMKIKPKILFETHRSRYHTENHDMTGPLRELFKRNYCVQTLISNEIGAQQWRKDVQPPYQIIRTDGVFRGLYANVPNEKALEYICNVGGVRAAFLAARN